MNQIEKILTYRSNDLHNGGTVSEKKKRVLLIESDGFTRITLMNYLVGAGFDVDFAPNGRLGLHQLRTWKPDALIVEINLRDLAGLELIKRARQEAQFGDRPIYVFTSTDFIKRSTRKELSALNAKIFDKLSIPAENFVFSVVAELSQGTAMLVRPGGKASAAGQNAAPGKLAEPMNEVCRQAKQLADCTELSKLVASCAELRDKVYALLSHSAVGGFQNTARQAKVLVGFLDRLCEHPELISDSALKTVAQSVEVLSLLARKGGRESEDPAKFKVVVVDEAPGSSQSICDALQEAGLSPVSFADAAQALEHLATEPADLIIANLSAGDQEGLNLGKIRALQLHQLTPVMVAPTVIPEAGDGSMSAETVVSAPEPVKNTELAMRALNLLQSSANTDAPANIAEALPEAAAEAGSRFSGLDVQQLDSNLDLAQGRVFGAAAMQPEVGFEPGAAYQQAAETQPNAGGKLRKRTILFVEDDPVLLKVYKRALRSEGFRVETVEDGMMAIDALPKVRPDLVVLDLMLPKMHGLEVLRFIRADLNFKATPVIILSNAFMEGLAAKAMKEGATLGLLKSQCTPARLTESINALVKPVYDAAPAPDENPQPESGTAFVAYGENGETSIWTRKSNSRRDAPGEIAKIRQACSAYAKVASSPESSEALTTLYRRVRFFCARSSLSGFTKLSEIAGALEALLFEIIYKKVQPTPSVIQTMAQTVDFLGGLVERGDTAFSEPMRRPQVLVVDDDAVCTLTTVAALKLARFEVVGTQDPKESLRLLESGSFDLVILDVQMPELDGFQVCERMRKMPQYKSCPVIFFTMSNDVNSRARGALLGASEFLRKPLTPAELTLKATLHWVKATKSGAAEEQQPVSQPVDLATAEDRSATLSAGSATSDSAPVLERTEETEAQQCANELGVVPRTSDPNPEPVVLPGAVETNRTEPLEVAEPVGMSAAVENSAGDPASSPEAGDQAGETSAESPEDPIAKYEKERQVLVNRVYNSENELHHERERVKRRERTIDSLQKKLESLRAKMDPEAAEAAAKNQLEVSGEAIAEQPDTATIGRQAEEVRTRCRQLEGELAALQKAREELDAKFALEQQTSAESVKRSQELETTLKERSTELELANIELEKRSQAQEEAEAALSRELETVGAAQKQAVERCAQLEREFAELQQAREAQDAKGAQEQQATAESIKRSQELEAKLSECSAELERAKAELEKRSQAQSEAEAELWRELETIGAAHKQAQERCGQLDKDLAELRISREELDGKVAREQQVSADSVKRSQEFEKNLNEVSAQLKRAQGELEAQGLDRARAEKELRQQLEAVVGTQQQSQTRCCELETELAELLQARQELAAKVAREQQAAAESSKRSQDLEAKLNERSAELACATAELEKRSKDQSKAEAELWRELETVGAAHKQAQGRCEQLEKDLAELRQARESLDARVAGEQQTAAESLKRSQDLEARLNESSAKLAGAKAELEKQARDRALAESELRQQLDAVTGVQQQSQTRCDQLENELAEMRKACEKLDARVAQEQQAAAELSQHSEQLQDELAGLRQAREELNLTVTREQQASSESSKRAEKLERQLRERSTELERTLAEMQNRSQGHTKTETELRQQLEATGSGLGQIQARCQELEAELAGLQKAREELNAKVAQEHQASTESGKRAAKLEKQLKERSAELEEALAEMQSRSQGHAKAETDLRRQLEMAGSELSQMRPRCQELEAELAGLQAARAELNAKVAKEHQASTESSKRAAALEAQLDKRTVELDRALAELQSRSNEQAKAEAELHQQLEAAGAAQSQAQARCQELEAELAGLQKARQELDASAAQEHQISVELGKRAAELERQLGNRTSELDRALVEMQNLSEEQDRVEAELRQQLEVAGAGQSQAQARCQQVEAELAGQLKVREELNAMVAREQQVSTELGKRAAEFEKQLVSRAAELEGAMLAMKNQAQEYSQSEGYLRQQLEATTAGRNQAQALNGQLEAGIAELQKVREELDARIARDQRALAEACKRAREFEKQLERAEAAHLREMGEMEERIRQGVSALAHTTTDLEKERVQRRNSNRQNVALSNKLQELHAELGRTLEQKRKHQQSIVRLEQYLREARENCLRLTGDLDQEQVRSQLLAEQLHKSGELNGKLQENVSSLDGANRVLLSTRENLQSMLEANLGKLHETESRLQMECADHRRLNAEFETAQRNLRGQGQMIDRQELQIKEALEAARELQSRLESEAAERQRLSEALDAAQRNVKSHAQTIERQEAQIKEVIEASRETLGQLQKETAEREHLVEELQIARRERCMESEQRRLAAAKLEVVVHREASERQRLETNFVRLRHATINAARTGRVVRNNLRRQVRQPVDQMLASTRRLVGIEMNGEQKALAENILEQLLLLNAAIQEPWVTGSSLPAGDVDRLVSSNGKQQH